MTSRELEDGAGYIHIPHFEHHRIVDEFNLALEQLRKAWGLILDVRDASRGDIDVAHQILERLIPKRQSRAYEVPMVVFLNTWSTPVAGEFATLLESSGRAKVIRARLAHALDPLLAKARVQLRTPFSPAPP